MTEMGVMAYLSQQPDLPVYLLRLLGLFMDENNNITMATEFIDSELFEQVSAGTMSFTEDRVMRYTWQLLHATRYLHEKHIGHRDISLENILISFGDDVAGQIRLMDFGQAVRTHSTCGTVPLRYFIHCGKRFYRAPECYLPRSPQPWVRAYVRAPATATPGQVVMAPILDANLRPTSYLAEVCLPSDVVPQEPCMATLWGYTVPPLDVFSCGVALFILSWKAPPWKMALLSDPGFNYLARGGGAIGRMVTSWQRPLLSPAAMDLLASMLLMDPARRPSVQECLGSPWFNPMAGTPVPTH